MLWHAWDRGSLILGLPIWTHDENPVTPWCYLGRTEAAVQGWKEAKQMEIWACLVHSLQGLNLRITVTFNFQHMLFPDALPFAVRPRSVDTNHIMSAIFGCTGHRWSFSGDSLFSRIVGCWGYLIILIISDFTRRLGVSERF